MRAWPLGALLVLASCGSKRAPLLDPPVAPTPLVRNAEPAPPRPAVPLEAPPAAAEPIAPLPPPPLEPRVLLEPLYSAHGHPLLATEMQTLGRDEELFQWALGGSSNPEHPSRRPGYHPATRVVVDVQLLSRAPLGSTKRLLRIARSSGYWPLRACFEDAQRALPKAERATKVRLTLAASGKVLGARSIGPTPEKGYARCALERLRELDFRPGFTRKLDVEISVKQWPGHAPVPPHAARDEPPLRASAETAAALQGLSPALVACYEPALRRDPQLWGRVALRLSLGDDGEVQQASPVETQFPDPEVTECARRAIVGARLPAAPARELTFAVRFGQPGVPPSPPPPVEGEPASPPAPAAPPAPEPASPQDS